jgi:two-component sensor histidine kinase
VPCGLIINELVSNSMKYAFPENYTVEKPKIRVALEQLEEQKFSLIISDNGIGIPKDYDFSKSKSLGLQLVHSLIAQIEGELTVNGSVGTEYKITFIDRNKVRVEKT